MAPTDQTPAVDVVLTKGSSAAVEEGAHPDQTSKLPKLGADTETSGMTSARHKATPDLPAPDSTSPNAPGTPGDEEQRAVTEPANYHVMVECPRCTAIVGGAGRTLAAPPGPAELAASNDLSLWPFPSDLVRSDAKTPPPTPPMEKTYLKYKAIYHDPKDGDILYSKESYDPIVHIDSIQNEQSNAVFDVVARLTARSHIPSWERGARLTAPPRAEDVVNYTIVIRSKAIIRALQSVVDFHPGINLNQDIITIDEPFSILVYHYEALQEYRRTRKPEILDAAACAVAADVYEHLGMLFDFLEQRVMKDVRAEQSRHARGVATWKMLWLLLRPGTDVAILESVNLAARRGKSDKEEPRPYISRYGLYGWERDFSLTKQGAFSRDGAVVHNFSTFGESYEITCWNLQYDGRCLGRAVQVITVDYFDGEMDLARLSVLPIQHCPKAPNGMGAREYLENQGRSFYALLHPQCKYHEGKTLTHPYDHVEGPVQIDFPTFYDKYPKRIPKFTPTEDKTRAKTHDCNCPACAVELHVQIDGHIRAPIDRYDSISPEIESSLLDHQYFLCPQNVWAYSFKARQWECLDVSNLTAPRYDPGMIDTLVIQPKRLHLLKSLSKSFIQKTKSSQTEQSESWNADFVKGKGNSRIFLLHGPPGVGKTYTAECIAEYTQRPLMTLTNCDVGIGSLNVEDDLEANFRLARKWGTILLLDEADIYLERRTLSDLHRNSLVAGFLRALESYEGILFLTTNRVGTFDDAFVSRIHVKLHYPALTNSDRHRIWNNFITKLKDDRGLTVRVMRDVHGYIDSEKVKMLRLNGREIRNIFQIAVGLAEFEQEKDEEGKIKVTEDHLAQVVEMSGEFKQYLDDLHVGDEEKRAERVKTRKAEQA